MHANIELCFQKFSLSMSVCQLVNFLFWLDYVFMVLEPHGSKSYDKLCVMFYANYIGT